jgi:hypothetical protein
VTWLRLMAIVPGAADQFSGFPLASMSLTVPPVSEQIMG